MLVLSSEVYRRVAEHLQAAYPNEGVGLLLGHAQGTYPDLRKVATAVLLLPNRSDTGEQYHRYLVTAEEMLDGETEAARQGLDIVGIFHSHPDSPAKPSEYDREFALPWYSYLIVSVQKGHAADANAWVLAEDRSQFGFEKLEIQSQSRQ